MAEAGQSVLNVDDLALSYELEGGGRIYALNGVSFSLRRGEVLGLVGESGCGKSTIAKSILKILPATAQLTSGRIFFRGRDLVQESEDRMRKLRWKGISLITQSAMNALDPVASIAAQMEETFLAHQRLGKDEILKKSSELFEKVGLNRSRLSDYPHQFSGGMRQRAVVAMAISLEPELILADEPTTALDVIMQAQVIHLLRSLAERQGIAIILITHDIAIVGEICDSVGVMYAGSIVEYGETERVFNNPYHPYTIGLKGAFPTIRDLAKPLVSIPGSPPRLTHPLAYCGFSERCPLSIEHCREKKPGQTQVEADHFVACHRFEEVPRLREETLQLFAERRSSG